MPFNKDGSRKTMAYKMKYQGNSSAFPFKSPMRDTPHETVEGHPAHEKEEKPSFMETHTALTPAQMDEMKINPKNRETTDYWKNNKTGRISTTSKD